jgi:hypothetical protein
MFIENNYNIGDIVYLKTDVDQHPRMILSIWVRPTGITYELGCGTASSYHFDLEISPEIDLQLKTNN